MNRCLHPMRTPEIPITLNLYAFSAIIDPPADLEEKMVDSFDSALVVAAPDVDTAHSAAWRDLNVQFPGAGKIVMINVIQIGRTDDWTPSLNPVGGNGTCHIVWRLHS